MAGSDFETKLIRVEGRARGSDHAALQSALANCLGALMQAGAAPAFLTAMIWSGPDPAALHPSRRVVDRIWREIFAGFRPPVQLKYCAGDEVSVEALADVPLAPASREPVLRGYNLAQLAQQMSPRGQVPDMGAVFAQWTREGDATRAAHNGLDLAYGAHRDECLDLYRPMGVSKPPVWVFLHGGYWQASSKDQHAQFCQGLVQAGFAVANVDYPLAPETGLGQIVTHVRKALHFLVDQAEFLGLDATRLHVAGHSAGGHLAAYLACDKLAPKLASAHVLSGVLDLEPLLHLPMARILGLKSLEQARMLSPLFKQPRAGTKIAIALGGAESDEFKRQSQALCEAWRTEPVLIIEGENHFSLLEHLKAGALLDQALRLSA